MAITETARTRAPRGTKTLMQAFFSALNEIPEAQQSAVAKAAQLGIRDELKLRRDKSRAATMRRATRKPAVAAPAPKPVKKPVRKAAAGRRSRMVDEETSET